MKRIFIGAAVAVMAMLSACEHPQVQGPDVPENQVVFTATLGADTKTFLEWDGEVYKTRWAADDYIYVFDPKTGEGEKFTIVEGAGTSQATFVGTLEADEYVAIYGNDPFCKEDDQYGVWLSDYWYYSDSQEIIDEATQTEKIQYLWENGSFPMVAKSSDRSLSFENLCSVLKLSITGSAGETIHRITVRSNDESVPLSGRASVDLSQDAPLLYFAQDDYFYNYVQIDCYMPLSTNPTDVYISLPAQIYEGGLTFELEAERSTMVASVTEDVELKRSRIRNVNINYSATSWEMPEDEWAVYLASGEEVPMTFENGYMVARDINLVDGFAFKNVSTGSYWSMYEGHIEYFNGYIPMNTAIDIQDNEAYWMSVITPANLDVYLDAYENKCFIMTSGITPDDIPTKEEVLGWDYQTLFYNIGNGELVKVQGRVVAKKTAGFVLALDNKYNNAVFVYAPDGDLADVQINQYLDIYAEKAEYRGLAQLKYTDSKGHWCTSLGSYSNTFDESVKVITDEFDDFDSDKYEYVGFLGTLEQNGSYYSVYVDGATIIGDIEDPVQDLSDYNNQKVYVEGYYVGKNSDANGNTYLNIALTMISALDDSGSTNDVLPGNDITVTY